MDVCNKYLGHNYYPSNKMMMIIICRAGHIHTTTACSLHHCQSRTVCFLFFLSFFFFLGGGGAILQKWFLVIFKFSVVNTKLEGILLTQFLLYSWQHITFSSLLSTFIIAECISSSSHSEWLKCGRASDQKKWPCCHVHEVSMLQLFRWWN